MVKIDVNLTGEAAPADFALLKAALVAAQAATPTARACRAAAAAAEAAPGFADLLGDADTAAARAHRFAVDGGADGA